MEKVFTIVIADRNPHVRGFLQRELSREGYGIGLAENARDLLQWAFNHEPVDLIILDPDLPDAVDAHLVEALQERMPPVPVVIHSHYANALPAARPDSSPLKKAAAASNASSRSPTPWCTKKRLHSRPDFYSRRPRKRRHTSVSSFF